MKLKVCNKCGGIKPLHAFSKNGNGGLRRKPTCKRCSQKTTALPALKRRAVKMWQKGKSLTEIGRAFGRDRRTVSFWLQAAGIKTTKRSMAIANIGRTGDADSLKPIGSLSTTSKWADVDAAIIRARLEAGMIDGRRRIVANPWPPQSSLCVW